MSQPPTLARAGAPPERTTEVRRPEGARPPVPIDGGLRARTIVLVGLMGVGKTTIGRGLATALAIPFRDSDEEVERAADRTVSEIFAERGEAAFRDGERRVIARLLTQEPPHVLAFGGGAFLNGETRALVRERAVSVWLRADLDILARRVSRKATRPLLQGKAPLDVLNAHAEARYPIYAEAELTVEAGEASSATTVSAVLQALAGRLGARELADAPAVAVGAAS